MPEHRLIWPISKNSSPYAHVKTDGDADPLGSMISSGHAMISAAGIGVVAGATAAAGSSNWIAEAVGAGGAVQWLLDWSKFAIGALWLVGVTWAYVLPLMPFFFIFMAAMTWSSALLESMIAVLLWSLTWLRQDDDDFAGRGQRAGLMLLFNLGLRPVLAILALCGSYVFLQITLGAAQKLWAAAFFGSTGGHISGLSGLIVSLLLLTYIQWFLCSKIFGLIASLPDRVAAWLEIPTTGQMGESGHMTAAVGGAVALSMRSTPGALPRTQQPGKPGKEDGSDHEVTAAIIPEKQTPSSNRQGDTQ